MYICICVIFYRIQAFIVTSNYTSFIVNLAKRSSLLLISREICKVSLFLWDTAFHSFKKFKKVSTSVGILLRATTRTVGNDTLDRFHAGIGIFAFIRHS